MNSKHLSFPWITSIVLGLFLSFLPGHVLADGTETLGSPSIAIAQGSGLVAAGVGLHQGQPGNITLHVPETTTVEQVLLYWEGQMQTDVPGDDLILVNGIAVRGILIGGPAYFTDTSYCSSYRADITDLGLVSPGPNVVSIQDLDFTTANNGAGLMVIYDDGVTTADIEIRDGIDLAFRDFPEPRQNTVLQTFTLNPVDFDRTADLYLFASSVANGYARPSSIEVTVDGSTVVLTDQLTSSDGEEWDTLYIPVLVPAGAAELAVQIFSRDDSASGNKPASLTWIGAGLALERPGVVENALIGDRVWFDKDNNGIQDPEEPGVPEVTVNLFDLQQQMVDSTATDSDGFYGFEVAPGAYCLEFIAPPEHLFSPQDQGGDDGVDSDVDPATGKTVFTTLDSGEIDPTWDAGLYSECGPCDGQIVQLTLKYHGCKSEWVKVYAGKKKKETLLFEGCVKPGATFTFTGQAPKYTMGPEISIYKGCSLNAKIHTSCSKPIFPGLIAGDFEIIEGYSKNGGKLCPTPPPGDDDCQGGVTHLTLLYTGCKCALIEVYSGKKKDWKKLLFVGFVKSDHTFSFTGNKNDLTMGEEISIYKNCCLNAMMHTSCSEPIGPGLVAGEFKVVDGSSKDGGNLPPMQFLFVDKQTISAVSGAVVHFTLEAGEAFKDRKYLMLGSTSGTQPGVNLPGGYATLPLNRDFFTDLVLAFANTPVFVDFRGTLDEQGAASAVFDTLGPIPMPAGTKGLTLHFAFALRKPWDFASNPVTVEIVP